MTFYIRRYLSQYWPLFVWDISYKNLHIRTLYGFIQNTLHKKAWAVKGSVYSVDGGPTDNILEILQREIFNVFPAQLISTENVSHRVRARKLPYKIDLNRGEGHIFKFKHQKSMDFVHFKPSTESNGKIDDGIRIRFRGSKVRCKYERILWWLKREGISMGFPVRGPKVRCKWPSQI